MEVAGIVLLAGMVFAVFIILTALLWEDEEDE